MSKSDEKQYGLILPKKQLAPTLKSNIFGDDNASDEDEGTDWVRKALKAENEKNKKKKQTRLNMQKALDEDPTIYQYDEVYDDMERTKEEQKVVKTEIKKPKYIHNLLKTAERRKREQEHRIERMVQKEREAEGAMYADKESFVTSAYRAKLEEFKKMEEEEARMDRLESIADVTKQQDMSGFYRHLFHQTVDNVDENNEKKNEQSTNVISNEIECEIKISEKSINLNKVKRNRQYRQRNIDEGSDSESDATVNNTKSSEQANDAISIEPEKKKFKSPENDIIDDNESRITEDESEEKKLKNEKNETDQQNQKEKEKNNSDTTKEKQFEEIKNEEIINEANKTEIKLIEPKRKTSIWIKRTVGSVFEIALQKYYERKATYQGSNLF